MLRRLSILSACFIVFALFVQTAEAQRTFHISDPQHAGINGVDPIDPNVYYYDSLEHLWADIPVVYTIDQGQDSIDFILYDNQTIYNNHAANSFFSMESSVAANRNMRFLTFDNQQYTIAPADPIVNSDFLRSASQHTNINISPNLTIRAGSNNDTGSDRSATSILRGGDYTAAGVTYLQGGPVTVDYNYGGVNRTGASFDVHSAVNLQGTVFLENSYNAVSRDAVVYLKDVANGVNLQNSKFLDNNGWGLRVEINDSHYRGTANIGINLGGTEGDYTIFDGNGTWAWETNPNYDPDDPDSPAQIRVQKHTGPGTGIIIGGAMPYSTGSQSTISLNFGGAGDVYMYDNMYGETSAQSGGSYRARINKNGSGTLVLGEGTRHQFNGTSQGTLGTGNRSNVWEHSAGVMVMEKDSRIELTTSFDQFIFGGGVIVLEGSSDPTGANNIGNYIQAHTIDFKSAGIGNMYQSNTKFLISADMINELTPTNKAILTLNAEVLTQPPNRSIIDFDITGLRGNINNKILVHNEGNGTFSYMQGNWPAGNPYYGRTYRALIDGNDVVETARIWADVIIANGGKDLVLDVTLNNTIVTAVRLTTGTGPLNWNVAGTVNWKYEIQSPTGTTTQNDMVRSAFIPNDAVVFNDFGKEGLTFNIMEGGVYMSQQVGYLSQNTPIDPSLDPGDYLFRQVQKIEYGMRVSGIYDWTFNGGSINDDYNPLQTYHEEQINHVGRLTFEGIGTLNLFNSNPNVYHDGTVVGNRGYDPDSLSHGAYFDPNSLAYNANRPNFDIEKHTIMNVYGPGSMGSGKYAGEIAEVDTNMDGVINANDVGHVIQGDGFGLKFTGYGGTINILNNANYNAMETDDLFDQRIRVVQANDGTANGGQDTRIVNTIDAVTGAFSYRNDIATTGIIRMEEGRVDANGNLIHIKVSAGDAYWVNHGRLQGENIQNGTNGPWVNTIQNGGVIFVDPNTSFEMTGHFDFAGNRILRSYEGTQITTVNFPNFDGGVLWVGYGASVNMTGASFTNNGTFFDRTLTGTTYNYTQNGNVRHGGAIYFTGGENALLPGNPVATLTLSAGTDGRTQMAENIANVGGGIYVARGMGSTINVENVDFTKNQAVLGGGMNDPVGGGAIYLWNGADVDGVVKNVTLNADGAAFKNNIAFGSQGGALRLFEGNTVNLNNAKFQFNGVGKVVTVDPDTGAPIELDEIDTIYTTFGGAIFTGRNTTITANGAETEFTSNAALNDGGAVYSIGDVATDQNNKFFFANAKFQGNVARDGSGGAIFSEKTMLTGDRSWFEKNTAAVNGGAIFIGSYNNAENNVDPIISLTSTNFISNEAGRHGGAIFMNPLLANNVTLNINDAFFDDNVTYDTNSMGGAIYAGGSHITINGSGAQFHNNMYGNASRDADPVAGTTDTHGQGIYGGAIFLGEIGTINMSENFAFIDNRVTNVDGRGGAIYTDIGATLVLTSGGFQGNIARKEGGAIYTMTDLVTPGTLDVAGTTFRGNRSETSTGGAIYSRNMLFSGEEATFTSNTAAISGGALHLLNDYAVDHATKTIVLNDARFDRNEAVGGVGGAVFIDFDGATLNADGVRFLGNRAYGNGGAIYATTNTEINVNDAVFDSSTEAPIRGNTSQRGSGGAIYLNGQVGTVEKATSKLNANGATFRNSVAGVDGGAVYLLFADAEISNAVFENNTATGRGGGLFFENENGKELIVETARFNANSGSFGGAIYTVNETTVQAKDTSLADNKATAGDGGAIYFAAGNSQLDVSRINSQAVIAFNEATGDGGAIRMQDNSKLIATGSAFNENVAGGSGGAIRIDGNVANGLTAEIHAPGASFFKNTATGNGGAIFLSDDSVAAFGANLNMINLNGSTFRNNTTTTGSGAAIHASNTTLNVSASDFSANMAAVDGGAIYLKDSDLVARGAGFTNNTAGTGETVGSKGGAIYFLTTNDHERTIFLGADTGTVSRISGNKMNGTPNSIYFETNRGVRSHVVLTVGTDTNGSVYMADPMKVDRTGNNLDLDIVKVGSGNWSLGGENDFSFTRTGTTVDIKGGTFELISGSTLKLTNEYDAADYIKLYAGATFATEGPVTQGTARLEATNLDFMVDSKMRLDENLAVNIANDYSIASRLTGNGGFTKEDANWLTFYGATDNYNGNVSIRAGKFSIAKHNYVAGSGRFVTEHGTFYMAPGTGLYMHADTSAPTLVAKAVTIDMVNLYVSGISGLYDEEFILIHTTDGITGNFANVEADGTMLSSVDYLTFNLGFMNGRKDYGGVIGLRWYSKDEGLPAWGKFTLVDEDDYFNVNVELHDNNINLYTADPNSPGYDPNWPIAWDGKTLDKLGLGTLELSGRNTYTGKTTVHAGEVYVTNPLGTGLGDAVVEVASQARLGLNFVGAYDKTVTGEGKVVVRGGTVELTAENNYSGGTDLKDGVLEFTSARNLGSGTVTFDGGTLRNKTTTTLDQAMKVNDNKAAKFDTPLFSADTSVPSLTVNGVIAGKGGLEKTGKGTLALAGQNTYTGTSYVYEGGLKVDGSVAGDVRVSQLASVGGKGHIGGDLFINSGAYFDWYFSPDRSASGPLNVAGSVNLADGAIFRPRTDDTDFYESIVGWTVMTYGGSLGGAFTAIDDTFNAYYDFELDYSVAGEIRVNGELLARPKAMGDIVATTLAISNKKLYRNSFTQMMRETSYRKYLPQHRHESVRGQSGRPTRSIWYTPMARANRFGTTFVGGNYDFEAYGMQAGSTLWSNNNNTLGLMFGYERGNLRNRLDQVRSHDYYLGLYYGHLFSDGYELRTFLGGGFQKYTMFRNDTVNQYKSTYDGSSFEMNAEFGKLFAGQNGTLLRPYIAADLEHGIISSAQEGAVGNAYRNYGKSDLTQFFFRFGLDLEKRWQYVDLNGGLSYTCLVLGKRRAEASIFYPVRGAGTTSYSARLGRSSLTLKTGLNWHLNRMRTNSFFVDYFADLYMDRAADTVQHTGAVGFQVRF